MRTLRRLDPLADGHLGLPDMIYPLPALLPTDKEGWIRSHGILLGPGSRAAFHPFEPVPVYLDPLVAAFGSPDSDFVNVTVLGGLGSDPLGMSGFSAKPSPLATSALAIVVDKRATVAPLSIEVRARAAVAFWLITRAITHGARRADIESDSLAGECLLWLSGGGGPKLEKPWMWIGADERDVHEMLSPPAASATAPPLAVMERHWSKHAAIGTRIIHDVADGTLTAALESARRLGADLDAVLDGYRERNEPGDANDRTQAPA
jgi:hypothetical protein